MSTTGLISPFNQNSLDIENIKTELRTYLTSNGTITDINFEGSNISVLIQILAFLEHGINSTIAMNSNQTMLLLSDIRQNIIYRAQELNYNITRRQSSRLSVTVSIPGLVVNDSLVVPRLTPIICGDNTFYTLEPITFTNVAGSSPVISNTATIIEGTLIDSSIDANLRIQPTSNIDSFIINYRDIENNNLYIRVQRASETEFSSNFNIVTSLLDLRNNENNAFVELDAETGYLRVVTRFAGQGIQLGQNDLIDISFLTSKGAEANGTSVCNNIGNRTTTMNNTVSVSVALTTPSSGGTNEESNDSIKSNAPLFYNSGNRTVNSDDYNSILERNSLVLFANSWGGESVIPRNLGHIYLTYIPQNSTQRYLSDSEEGSLLVFLSDLHFPAVGYILNKPNYIQHDFTIQLVGDLSNVEDKQAQIRTTLTNYYTNTVRRFKTEFFEAKAISVVEALFNDLPRASVKTTINPKILLSTEMFSDFVSLGNEVQVYIPVSPSRYYLVKNNSRIELPDEEQDLYTFLRNGWRKELRANFDFNVTFSGTINSKTLTEAAQDTITIDSVVYPKKDLLLDGTTIGYYNIELHKIVFTTNLTSDLVTNQFISINYNDDINVISERNSIIELGNITFS